MLFGKTKARRRAALAALTLGAVYQLGFLESCNDRLVGFTRYVDPCVSPLFNCAPGDFQTNAAGVGDFCIDPTCPIPGQCDNGQALGTITDLCP